MHTFGNSPYYLVKHYENGLLLTSVGKFCDTCEKFVVEDGFVFVGAGVSYDEESGNCYDADGNALPEYVSEKIASGDFGDWKNLLNKPTNNVNIYADTSITLNATYGADRANAYDGVVFVIRMADGTEMYFIRPSGDSSSMPINDSSWGKNYGDTVMKQPGFVTGEAETAVKTAVSLEVTVSLDSATDVMTIVYTASDAEGEVVSTLTWTISGMTADSYELGFANDGATITGNVSIVMGAAQA